MSRKGGFFSNLFKKNKAANAPAATAKVSAIPGASEGPVISSKVNQSATSPTDTVTSQHISVRRRSSAKENTDPETQMRSSINQSLENQPYFHGKLPRDEIDFLLKSNGDFIVRESMKGNEVQVVLSVFWDCARHFIVRTDGEGKFKLEGQSFPTVPLLIFHYFESKENVSKLSAAKLLKPITKEKWELNNNDIELGKLLGQGNFGEVYRGYYTNPYDGSRTDVAIKTCKDTMPDSEKKLFLREARIMRRYKHENIVQLIGVCATKEPMMIVMELVTGGGLDDYLKKNAHRQVTVPVLKEKVKFCKEAASGMEYLSNQECLHRDLAARNCLLTKNNTVKIADFGMSREGSFYEISAQKQMPIRWTALEVIMHKKFTTKSDVWAYGILMWEIFENGKTPYPEYNDNKKAVIAINAGERMQPPPSMPEPLGKLMLSCWLKDPEERPDFTVIRKTCFAVYSLFD